jgi:hypothetical protein
MDTMNAYIVTSYTFPAILISAKTPEVAARKYARRYSTRNHPFVVDVSPPDSFTMREKDGTERDTIIVTPA